MDKLGIKATIYDILGYITPGLLLIIIVYMFIYNLDLSWIISLKFISFSTPFYILILIISYVSGHIISSLSSYIFENCLVKKLTNIFIKRDNKLLDEKCIVLVGKEYEKCDKQLITSYCQIKYPSIYDTSFAFLTFYGLSRNISIVFIILDMFVIDKYGFFTIQNIVVFLLLILLIRNYYRFKKYYNEKIDSSLFI